MCKNLPHILLCTLDYKEDKLNSKYTWTHFRRKALFQKPPNNFSYFQPELHCITCIRQQFGKEEETIWARRWFQHSGSFLNYMVIFWVVMRAGGHYWHLVDESQGGPMSWKVYGCFTWGSAVQNANREKTGEKIIIIRKQGEWPTNTQTSVSATEIHSSERDYLYL